MAYINQETKKAIKSALDDLKLPKTWRISLSISHGSSLNINILRAPKTVLDDYVPTEYQLENNPNLVVDETTSLYINEKNPGVSWKGETLKVLDRILETVRTAGKWFDKSDSQSDYFHVAFWIHMGFGSRNKECEFVGRRRRIAPKSDIVAEVAAERGIPVIDINVTEMAPTELVWGESGHGETKADVIDQRDNVIQMFVTEQREPTLAEKIAIARCEMIARFVEAFRATPAGSQLSETALVKLAEAALKVTVD